MSRDLVVYWKVHHNLVQLLSTCFCFFDKVWKTDGLMFGNLHSQHNLYVPTCIHLFPHARTDTMQVVEHEPNFSKFYPLTISFLVSQFCTLESSLCVSSSDYYLISPFGSSLTKVVLNPKIRTTECTHQTTVSTQNELMIDNNVDLCANPIIDRLGTKELNT